MRVASLKAALVTIVAVAGLAGAARAGPAADGGFDPRDLSGVWRLTGVGPTSRSAPSERILRTTTGEIAPMQPPVAKIYQDHIAAEEAGRPLATNMAQCLPTGMPKLAVRGGGYPIQFLQTPGQLTLIYEELGEVRIIHLDRRHPAELDPTYRGDSVGHWEGEVLVIDTIGLNDKTDVDQLGMPHTEKMHVVERLHRVGKDRMEAIVVLDDPGAFVRPFAIERGYEREPPGTEIAEFVCQENNRNPVVNGVQTLR